MPNLINRVYKDANGIMHTDGKPFKQKISLGALETGNGDRMAEVLFYFIIQQFMSSKGAAIAPMGTTIPILLSSLVAKTQPQVLDHAFNTLNMPEHKPTTEDICVALKYFGVSAKASPYTPETYYKGIRNGVDGGRTIKEPILASIQTQQVKRFISGYLEAFMGKNRCLSKVGKTWK